MENLASVKRWKAKGGLIVKKQIDRQILTQTQTHTEKERRLIRE